MDKKKFKQLTSEIEKYELTDEVRAKSEGSFVALPCGNTHYELKGEGEAIVLVHGYATPYYIYDKLFDGFVKAGYKVLRYDLLGRGLSERVNKKYTPELFAEQLKELVDTVLPNESFYLTGTSMGGAIVTAYIAKYSDKVKKLFLLAPAGMNFKAPAYMKLSNIPVLGEIIFYLLGTKILLKKCSSELIYSKDESDYYMEKFAESIKYKGFSRATLSSLRNTILNQKVTIPNYMEVEKTDIPIVLIWGTIDKTMPYYQVKQLKSIIPRTKLYTFENSGHIFLFDEGQRTLDILLKEIEK
ncbi:MAG: alpha/beta hydrolase [Clostridia bacterium]